MAKYAIGLDGGGTKTEIAMLSAQGETIYMGRLGPLNPVSYPDSPAEIAKELAKFIDADCAAICVACAGAADKAKAEGVKRAMDGIFAGPVFVRTDGEIRSILPLGSATALPLYRAPAAYAMPRRAVLRRAAAAAAMCWTMRAAHTQ